MWSLNSQTFRGEDMKNLVLRFINDTEGQDLMVQQYVNNRIKGDPIFTSSQQSLEQEAGVVPVALELGMVMLQRAQGQKDAAIRKEQLQNWKT